MSRQIIKNEKAKRDLIDIALYLGETIQLLQASS